MNDWRTSIPRKLRKVTDGKKEQFLISVPASIARMYQDDVFTCSVHDGAITFHPIRTESENSDAA